MNQQFRFDVLESMLGNCNPPEIAKPVIRPIRDMAELQQVYRLHHDCFVACGYSESHPTQMIVSNAPHDLLEQTTILIALHNEKIIGSVSLTTDSLSGLTIDEKFKDLCDSIRKEGKKCGAIWRLIVEESPQSHMVIMSLMLAVRDFILHEKIETLLLTVNPNQVDIYQRMLNAKVVAQYESKQEIPRGTWVLLRFNAADVPTQSPISPERVAPDPNFHPVRSFLLTSDPELLGSDTEHQVIRPIRGMAELRQVYHLTHDCYVASGYFSSHPTQMFISYPQYDLLEQTTIFIAIEKGKIIGSISLTMDGPGGFTVDENFKETCDAVRREGKRCGNLWRLVLEESPQSQKVLMALLLVVREFVLHEKIATLLIAVDPDQVNIYQRVLDATEVAHFKPNTDGFVGPNVLLRFDPSKLPSHSPVSPHRIALDQSFHPKQSFIINKDMKG